MALSYTLTISEKKLQSRVSAMMPLEKKKYLMTVVLSNPVVDLTRGNNEIAMFCHIDVFAPGAIKGSGMGKISGTLSYDSDMGAIFFNNPEVVSLQIRHVPEKYIPGVKKVIQMVVNKFLTKHPVYRLKADTLKHKVARLTLTTIKVENKKLLLVFRV